MLNMNNSLKEAWSKYFKIGTAVSREMLEFKENIDLIKQHFSSVTAENAMKLGLIHPEENKWNWDECDLIANFAREENLAMRGHTMVWHNQNPTWLYQEGNDTVSKNVLYKRLEDHIFKVTERYNDIIYAWDVLNEAIDTDIDNGFRLSKWYRICGSEVYDFAFKTMRQAAPKAKLFYNDYNNEYGKKMDVSIRFLSSLLDAGIPIDGIGIQGHWYYDYPDEETLRNALNKYSALGLDIELTEVDVSAYQFDEARDSKEFLSSMPQDRIEQQAQCYKTIFNVAADYPSVKNITMWGIADNYTWLDYFPVKDRKNWPLLFDEQYKPKPFVAELIEMGKNK